MLRLSRVLAAGLALFVSSSALAVELNYQWKKGDKHRFQYEDDTVFEMAMSGGMPGMAAMGGAGMRMKVQTNFTQKVLAVRKDGTADVELTVEKLDLFQGGAKVASIAQIPPAARVVKAEVDRKGHAKFYQMVTVYMQDDQVFVGVKAHAGPTSASGSATVGNQQVDVVAAVDPKTGKVTASMKVTERPPALKKVVIKQEDPGVDVLPKQIFDMMVLPEGSMEPGSRVDVAMPLGKISVELSALEGTLAKLRSRMDGKKVEVPTSADQQVVHARGSSKKKAAVVHASAEGDEMEMGAGDTEDTGEEMGEMPSGDMDMGGMDMGGMDMGGMDMGGAPGGEGMAAGGAPSAGMKMAFDVTCGFDVAAGKLMTLAGTMASDMSMGGMGSMKVNSRFSLKRVP
ncbi:MAG: hypothetical protein JXB05_31185 [Myxococcaceae bacterium]|nr:hypothetical protein [Myxococcaceae bacterium]